ncbi:MAG: MoaD/ThiS family protein [Acidobacteriota bacterium]|jgi:molybdopterin converting factor subunit 1
MSATVQVRLFARLREVCDNRALVELSLPEPATTADCFAVLSRSYPGAATLRDGLAVAVNDEYAAWDRTLEDGDEVAFIPPVSGGMQTSVGGRAGQRGKSSAGGEEA